MSSIKLFALLSLSSLLLIPHATAFINLKTTEKDPELAQCKHLCKHQQGFDEAQRQECMQRCQRYYEEKHAAAAAAAAAAGRGKDPSEDPMKRYSQCRRQCQQESEPGTPQQQVEEMCKRKCLEELKEKQENNDDHEKEGKGGDDMPYVFEDKYFATVFKTQYGKLKLLPKFSERSKLLKGVENYRVAVLEVEPMAFGVPIHSDADLVIFVAQGKGTMSLIREEKRESVSLKCGDILRIYAGTIAYLINGDNNEKLVLAKLYHPIFTSGRFQAFVGAGGENPPSFFNAFSSELLEAAFNTKGDRLQKMFQNNKGAFMKASEEQIKAMSHHEGGGIWPFSEPKGTINLYEMHPTQSNDFGELREISPDDYKQLQDINIGVSFANITKGAMMTPYYNSMATKISIVLNGEGYFEMACPHLSSSSESGKSHDDKHKGSQKGQQSYQKVNAHLRSGTVVIAPVGHPVIMAASRNQNLEVVCFEINASDNQKIPLAGRRNIWNEMEREAKELAFGLPSTEVDEILRSQDQDWFFKGPRQVPEQQGHADE